MIELLAPVLGLALLDSLNPSALVVTLYLLTQPHAAGKIIVYMSAVFMVYFSIGVLLMLGLDAILAGVGEALYSSAAYGVQGVLGAGMLIYSLATDTKKQRERAPRLPQSQSVGALFLLGLSISAVEFATALPYLGAIGILTNAGLGIIQWLPILVVYNLIFVLPPFLLLAAYRLFGDRMQQRFEHYRETLQKGAHETFLWIIGIIGFFLLADSLRYFEFFGLLGSEIAIPTQ